jgi:putative transposase
VNLMRSLATAGPGGRPAPEILYGRRKMTVWLNKTLTAGHGSHDGAQAAGEPATGQAGCSEPVRVSQRRVGRLMHQEGMQGLRRSRSVRTTIPARDGKRAGDLLNRCFSAEAPNLAWVTDFTYVPTWSGFTYVALVIDLCSRFIVGWSASTNKREAFVEDALKMAIWRRDHVGRPMTPKMIHHSDAGSQYTSIRYTETLALEDFSASIGSVGDAYDNAAAETVMGLFKHEAIRADSPFRDGPLRGIGEVEKITLEYVDWYNHHRFHSSLDYQTPEEYERAYYTQDHRPTTR